jgi:hypothetical protein
LEHLHQVVPTGDLLHLIGIPVHLMISFDFHIDISIRDSYPLLRG